MVRGPARECSGRFRAHWRRDGEHAMDFVTVSLECRVDLCMAWPARAGEGALPGDFPGSLQEPGPGRARERAADADASHPGIGELLHRGEVTPTRTLTGFGATAVDDGRDLGGVPDAGGKEAVGAGLGVGGEPAYGLGEIGPPDDEALGTRGEQDAGAALVDRASCRLDPLEREREIEQGAAALPVESSSTIPRYRSASRPPR